MYKHVLFMLLVSGGAVASHTVSYVLDGKPVDAQVALLAAAQGREVLKCQLVVAKVSKTGTSIGLRAKK